MLPGGPTSAAQKISREAGHLDCFLYQQLQLTALYFPPRRGPGRPADARIPEARAGRRPTKEIWVGFPAGVQINYVTLNLE